MIKFFMLLLKDSKSYVTNLTVLIFLKSYIYVSYMLLLFC